MRAAAWGSAALLCTSLVVFLVAAEPRGGHPDPTRAARTWALLAICATAQRAPRWAAGGRPSAAPGAWPWPRRCWPRSTGRKVKDDYRLEAHSAAVLLVGRVSA